MSEARGGIAASIYPRAEPSAVGEQRRGDWEPSMAGGKLVAAAESYGDVFPVTPRAVIAVAGEGGLAGGHRASFGGLR